MITLTKRLDNGKIYFNPVLIAAITTQVVHGTKEVETIVFIHGMAFHVKETPQKVLDLVAEAKQKDNPPF